jgi:cell division septal protein FtsQ
MRIDAALRAKTIEVRQAVHQLAQIPAQRNLEAARVPGKGRDLIQDDLLHILAVQLRVQNPPAVRT